MTTSLSALDRYLARLPEGPNPQSSLWRAADGSVQDQFFACALASAFQPVYALGLTGRQLAGFGGVARGVAAADEGLSVQRLLDQAASDDESIELDRLCRVLHAINYFRQPAAAGGADLYLGVHDRLLTAVSSNHGAAFLRMLNVLELPVDRVVLQLPPIGPSSRWLANYVADNYRRNGFRLAFTAATVDDATALVAQFQPYAIVLDARAGTDPAPLARLLGLARDAGVNVLVKGAEPASLAVVAQSSTEVVH